MKIRKIVEKFTEGILFTSSTVTTIAVLFIVYFLFKSGIGLFSESPVEQGYTLAVNSTNPVGTLNSKQIKAIFNGDITNWKDVGGKDQDIQLFTIDELSAAYTEEQLGSKFENIPACVNDYFSKNDNVFAFFESSRYPAHFIGRKLKVPNITVWEF